MRPRILGLLAAVLVAVPTVGLAAPIGYRSVLTSTNGTANGTLTFNYDAAIDRIDSLSVAFADGASGLRQQITSAFGAADVLKVLTDATAPYDIGVSSGFSSGSFNYFMFFSYAGSTPSYYDIRTSNGMEYLGNFSAATVVGTTTAVPEPDTMALLLLSAAAMSFALRRRDRGLHATRMQPAASAC